jgi:hypothetical protein
MRSFCQDRLGTNIEKTQKGLPFFSGMGTPAEQMIKETEGAGGDGDNSNAVVAQSPGGIRAAP